MAPQPVLQPAPVEPTVSEPRTLVTLNNLRGSSLPNNIPADHKRALEVLAQRLNSFLQGYQGPIIVTSGYRSMETHLRIYTQKGVTDQTKIPMKSKHLFGQAADIGDSKRELQKYVLDNTHLLEQYELWCEDFSATPNWVHFQTAPPLSGKRFFKP